jgi:uncharacterized protein
MISIDQWKGQIEDIKLLSRCKELIQRVVPDAQVILYGSRARGDATEYSDYDILVLVNGTADIPVHEKIISSIFPLELDTGAVLTLIIYNRQQWDTPLYRAMPLHENIDSEGVVL